MQEFKIHSETRIGHVHLTVSSLEKSVEFYRDVLGFEITQELNGAVFLSAGGYHHTIGLNSWSKSGARTPEEGQIGLYHFAILYPSRKELAKAVKRLLETRYPLEGASDHRVSESIYLKDPDGNGIELYADRNEKNWSKDEKGNLQMVIQELDVAKLLEEAE